MLINYFKYLNDMIEEQREKCYVHVGWSITKLNKSVSNTCPLEDEDREGK